MAARKPLVLNRTGGVVEELPAGDTLSAAASMTVRVGSATADTALKVWVGTATSTAAGLATATIPTGYFTTVTMAFAGVTRANVTATGFGGAEITALTTTSVTAQAWESKTTAVVVGGSVEGLEASSGVTVNLLVLGT